MYVTGVQNRGIVRYQALASRGPIDNFFPYLIFRYRDGAIKQICIRERSYPSEDDAIASAHRYARAVLRETFEGR
jgi:hypothetical protein